MATIEVNGKRVEVGEEFLSLSPAEQERTVEEIAASLGSPEDTGENGAMGQLNQGIAESVGGFVDFLNPFDKPHNLNPFKDGTGSAVAGLENVMDAGGIARAQQEPDGLVQSFMRGSGQAAGALVPAAKAAQTLKGAGGVLGNIADDAFAGMTTRAGMGAEIAAGGVSAGARDLVADAGGGEVAQNIAAMASPMGIPAAMAATRGAGAVAKQLPLTGYLSRMAGDVKSSIFPMTNSGAREVARNRLIDVAGGQANAEEYAARISPQSPLTPAQQIEEPEFFGLEAALRNESPAARKRLDGRIDNLEKETREYLGLMGEGDVGAAQSFMDMRTNSFETSMRNRSGLLERMADERLENVGPRQSEMGASQVTSAKLKDELNKELAEERRLWSEIPKEVKVDTSSTRDTVEELISSTPWAQRRNIPADIRTAFGENGAIGDNPSVKELHGLYSEMRRVARSAMAGNDQNKDMARIANEVAEAILTDLGSAEGPENVAQSLSAARAFSRTLHEKFDRGAVGAILKRTIDGDTTMNSAVALNRTIGTGGPGGRAALDELGEATPSILNEADDFLRGKFLDAAVSASGDFSASKARTWMRQNRETLAKLPEMRDELAGALRSKESAAALRARSEARIKLSEKGPGAKFAATPSHKAALSIIGARDPVKTAKSLVQTARKDETGEALGGLKASLSNFLISSSMDKSGALSGASLRHALRDERLSGAMQAVLGPDEFKRLETVAASLAKAELSRKASPGGPVLDTPANTILDTIVRMQAARIGGAAGAGGGMGGSLQTANIFADRARNALYNLTNRKAREILGAAIEDGELMKALMTQATVEMTPQTRSALAPYLVGAVAEGETNNGVLSDLLSAE